MKKEKKPKDPYAFMRRTWTRNPKTQVLTNKRVYKRQQAKKAVRSQDDSLLFSFGCAADSLFLIISMINDTTFCPNLKVYNIIR